LCPQQGDAIATKKVCIAVVQVCFAAAKWTELNEHIVLLSKRRSQLKQAVTGMVQEAMTYIDQVTARPHPPFHALSEHHQQQPGSGATPGCSDRRLPSRRISFLFLSQAIDWGL